MTRTVAIAALVFVTACTSGTIEVPTHDAGTAADYHPPECDVQFGDTYILDEVVILPEGEGVDITGDEVVDNLLYKLAPLANPVNANDIQAGTAVFLLDYTDWNGTANDDDVTFTFYLGVDTDSPPDPSNNFDGEGTFKVHDRQFDVNCNALTSQSGGTITDGLTEAVAEKWRFVVQTAGTIEYRNIHAFFQFDESLEEFSGPFGAAWTICNLSTVSGSLFAGENALRTIVNNLEEPNPDLDVDGDGLESLVGDGNDIVMCIDGDGTEIPGPECACDPRIADAYSISIRAHGVKSEITGIIYR